MKLVDLIAQYLAFLTAKGLSSHTRRTYGNQMRHYAHWWESTHQTAPGMEAFCEEDLFAYIQGEEKRGQRPRSRHSKACALRSFGKWLVAFGHIADNPAARLPLPRLDDPQRELMSAAEVAALLSACDRFPRHERGILAKAILVTFLSTGVRRSELLTLCVADIDIAAKILIVRHGKGGKYRQMPLHEEACAALAAWLAVRSPHAPTDSLFLSQAFAGRPIRTRTARGISSPTCWLKTGWTSRRSRTCSGIRASRRPGPTSAPTWTANGAR
jgi:site-specific recombinase XerD